MKLRKLAVVLAVITISAPTSAASISTIISGYFAQSGTMTNWSNNNTTSVSQGDRFSLIFNYDDELFVESLYFANGRNYYVNTYGISLAGGTGSLYDFEVANFSLEGGLSSLKRNRIVPSPEDNRTWGIGNLMLITDYAGYGSGGYGFMNYGGPNQLGVLLTDVTNTPISPVPAPPAALLMLSGLGVLGLIKRFRKADKEA